MERPTAYGQACSQCVKAKCRCVPREDKICERCHRLSKDCQPAAFVRKRGSKRSTASAKKSQLEEKLDSLVSLLQAQSTPNSTTGTASASEPTATPPVPTRNPQPLPYTGEPSLSKVRSAVGTSPQDAAERTLDVFRTRYLAYFPFVHLPKETTAEQLQRERPFTFKAIRVVCEAPRTLHNDMGTAFIKEVSDLVVVEGQRSLDLLTSLLACAVWQFYFTHAKPFVGLYLGLVRSLIVYLRLDRPLDVVLSRPKFPKFSELSEVSPTRTDEERRVLITCFAYYGMLAMSLRYDPIKWSRQHDEACEKLSENLHILGDQVLVAIYRISKVSVEIANTIMQLSDDPEYAARALLHVKTLRLLLDQVKSTLTSEQLDHTLVQSFLQATYVYMYEVALYQPPNILASQPDLHLLRTEYLSACMYATKAALDNAIGHSLIHMNMTHILGFSHAAQVLYKLSVLDCPGWDRTLCRATVDVLWYFEQAACRMEQANAELIQEYGSEEANVYSQAGPAWRGTAAIWKEGLDHAGAALEPQAEVGVAGANAPTFDAMDTSWLSVPDDVWFSNVLFG